MVAKVDALHQRTVGVVFGRWSSSSIIMRVNGSQGHLLVTHTIPHTPMLLLHHTRSVRRASGFVQTPVTEIDHCSQS